MSLPVRWLGRREGIVLFVAFVLVAALFVFIKIAEEVLGGHRISRARR